MNGPDPNIRKLNTRIPVLTYHSLDDSGSPVSIAPAFFRWQMEYLRATGWRTLTLDQFLDGHGRGSWPARSFLLTFDDGFANVAEQAVPVLSACGFTGIIFVVADWAGRTNDWPGQPSWVSRHLLLDWGMLRAIAEHGMEIGCHTCSHPHLPHLPTAAAEREVVDAKKVIEARIGKPVRAFAYPYGETSTTLRKVVAAHFGAGFGTRLGLVSKASQVTAFERVDAYYVRRPGLFRWLESRPFSAYLHARQWIRDLRQMGSLH